jgi:hypothetical protein
MLDSLWNYALSIISTVKDMRDGKLAIDEDSLYDLESDLELSLNIVRDMIEQRNDASD